METKFTKQQVTCVSTGKTWNGLSQKDKAFRTFHLVNPFFATDIDTIRIHDLFVELLLVMHAVDKALAIRSISHTDYSTNPFSDILRDTCSIPGLQTLTFLSYDQEVPFEVHHILRSDKVNNARGVLHFGIGKVTNYIWGRLFIMFCLSAATCITNATASIAN